MIGGTRDLKGLWQARRRGIRIVQRLDGMNWLHRVTGFRKTGIRHFLRAEYGNGLLSLIRSRFANRIVYQSEFSRSWWERVHGRVSVEQRVIYNGVDLNFFSMLADETPPKDRLRVLMVEGNLMGGYEQGISVALQFMQALSDLLAS